MSKSLIIQHFNKLIKASRESIESAEDDKGLPEDYEIFQNCIKEFKKRKYLQIIKMDYEMKNILKPISDIEEKTKTALLELRAEKRLDRYIFLTINPPDNHISLDEFHKLVKRAVNRKFVKGYHYVFEQRGLSLEKVKGIHCHLLFVRDIKYKPAIIKRDLKNTFKKCFKKITDNNFNFKKCGLEFYTKRLAYIMGEKTEEGKDLKMKVDKEFRKKYNLKDIYSN